MSKEFDKTLEQSYRQLAEADKVCYQLACESAPGAIKVWNLGWFALTAYDEQHKDAIVAVCKKWLFCIYKTWGIDQDHDAGIYDIEHDESFEHLRPANCVWMNGEVVELVDGAGRVYRIGKGLGTQWSVDKGHGSTVDFVSYSLSCR